MMMSREAYFVKRISYFASRVAVICMTLMSAGCELHRAKFAFGVVSDVHYSSDDNNESIKTLARSAAFFNSKRMIDNESYVGAARRPKFVIQLGDIISSNGNNQAKSVKRNTKYASRDTLGAIADLDTILEVFNTIKSKKYHALGNHEFDVLDRQTVLKKLGMKRAYYNFIYGKWRFVVLDTADLSVRGGWSQSSVNYRMGRDFLSRLQAENAPNATEYNGAVGDEQKRWLKGVLANAEKKSQRVVVFGHVPLTPADDKYTLWNSREIISLLESYSCVFAYINGHRYKDDYVWRNGIYYVTIEAISESPGISRPQKMCVPNRRRDPFPKDGIESLGKNVYAVVWVYSDRLLIESTHKEKRLSLPIVKLE